MMNEIHEDKNNNHFIKDTQGISPTAAEVVETLLSFKKENMKSNFKEPINIETAYNQLKDNHYSMPVSYAGDHKQVASRVACGDGRTIANHIKSVSEAKPTIQLF
jgi:hypothetical protein